MESGLTPRLDRWVTANFGEESAFLLRHLRAYETATSSQEPERILTAIALVASRRSLPEALEQARVDWRDLLASAGLADENWPEVVEQTLGPASG